MSDEQDLEKEVQNIENGSSRDREPNSPLQGKNEQERYLPIANISRIMKKAVGQNAKVAKPAKETVQECVSEFISFITSEASEKCQNEKRKTINGEDILWAMQTLGFDNYIEPLRVYLAKYRDSVQNAPPKPRSSSSSSTSSSSKTYQKKDDYNSNYYATEGYSEPEGGESVGKETAP